MHKKFYILLSIIFISLYISNCSGKNTTKNFSGKLGPHYSNKGIQFFFKPTVHEGGLQPKKIFLAGSFNGWRPNDPNYELKDSDKDGIWSILIKLDPGEYQYKFVVDNKWIQDKFNPKSVSDELDGRNSVLVVK